MEEPSKLERAALEHASRNGIDLYYEADKRLVRLSFSVSLTEKTASADDAVWVLEQIDRWVGARPIKRYGCLVDCTHIERGDTGWRATLADYYRAQPPGMACVAWYNLRPITRVMVDMFATAIRTIAGMTVDGVVDACAWLRERGVG